MRRALRWASDLGVVSVLAVFFAGCSNQPKEIEQARNKTKTPATMHGVELHPNPAQANNRIEATVTADPFAETSILEFTWRRNGVRIDGEGRSYLDPGRFTKGDVVSVEVRSLDPERGADATYTASVTITNTPPKILSAYTLMGITDKPEIYVRAECLDVDKDEVMLSYRWFIDDEPIRDQSGPSIDPSLVARGARVSTEVVASDGESSSSTFTSEPITIENHPPRISSTPPSTSTKEGAFRYHVQAEDADSDSLTYELVTAPAGMSIDKRGDVTWTLPPAAERAGPHTVRIKVTDLKGASATQEFTFSFAKNQPAPLQASQVKPGT